MREDQGGFTLVELLVVMLILGTLAAIAIPTFFNQRDKAKDSEAKSMTRTAMTAMETRLTENGYDIGEVTNAALQGIEPTLNEADGLLVFPAFGGYAVAVRSDTGTYFALIRDGTGKTLPICNPANGAGCKADGTW